MGLRIGRYETVKPIASGGMATVYLGRALGAGGFERLVGIKMMHPHIATDPEFVSMFLDEARLAARVRHPNVVATIDVQESDQGLALVMEYVEGPSLHALLRKVNKSGALLPRPILLRIFLDTLMGLHAAHELTDAQGKSLELIHRDVSPQNVLVGVDGISKITDFGVARASSRLTSTRGGQLKGKLAYMAPEQMKNEAIDRRCDVYAAGILLWEMLTGKRMFHAESEGALVLAVLAGTKQPPSAIEPSVPEAIDKVCMRAVEKDVDARFPTALAFAEALEDAALEVGSSIATPRAVTAFVLEKQAHERPDLSGMDGGASDQPISKPSQIVSVPSKVSTSVPAPGQEGAGTTDDVASVALTRIGPPPRSGRRIAIFAAIGVGLVAAVLFLARAFVGDDSSRQAASAARIVETAAPASADIAAPTPPPQVAPAPPSAAAPPATATAATAPSTAMTASPKGGPRRAAPTPRAGPTAFRPSDL